jgi:hypothetical protein
MTIEEAVDYLVQRGFVAQSFQNNTGIAGGTKRVPLGDIVGIRNSFGIYPDKGNWVVVIPDQHKTVQTASLWDAVQTAVDLVSPLLNEPNKSE